MELKDIIKSNADRLFVLDNECFIIFTADDLTDEKAFIRIGNWINIPPESIPLIENIIVTDSITGDPAYEQFNIDPKYLSTNKYIGSKQVVQNYLDFQKNFGLDLNNVSTVDVEKDLPYLSKEKSISSKDSFLGIFYRNGNFRVIYKDETLFDLTEYENKSPIILKKHELISNAYKESLRYNGAGILIYGNSALFYKNRYFTSYQFPKEYLSDFNNNSIDPAKIREILLPYPNLTNITGFMKWCNSRRSVIKIFSDSKTAADSVQKLFPDIFIKRNDFHGHSFDTGDGLTVQNYPGSINIKLTYRNVLPGVKKLELAFITEYTGLQEILNEKLDGIIVQYSIYSQALLYFRSCTTPFMCVNDGNKEISRLKGNSIIILNQKIQYEFYKFNDESIIQNVLKMLLEKDIIEYINTKNIEEIKRILFDNIQIKNNPELHEIKKLLNLTSFLKIILNSTTDRKFSSELKKIIQKVDSLFDKEAIISSNSKYSLKVLLYFYNNIIFDFYDIPETLTANEALLEDPSQERIQIDRIRFNDLLSLYKNTQYKTKKDLNDLTNEINKRKEFYIKDELSIDQKEIKRNILKIKLKKLLKIIIPLLLIIILSLISISGFKYYMKYREIQRVEKEKQEKIKAEKKQIEKEKNEKTELIEKYKIHVSDHDIYKYANKVARKNGYREIDYKALKEKNPNWIFPGNIFYLLDSEKIVVKAGDTLWDISDRKLMEINFAFYQLINKIEKTDSITEKSKLLEDAIKIAFTNKHFKEIDDIKRGSWNQKTK